MYAIYFNAQTSLMRSRYCAARRAVLAALCLLCLNLWCGHALAAPGTVPPGIAQGTSPSGADSSGGIPDSGGINPNPVVQEEYIPVPKGLSANISPYDAPERILCAFLGIPYRNDGVIDVNGNYTLFARQDAIQSTPGLNCSGYVIAAFRFLVNRNIPLSEVGFDRLDDSGPDSPHGHDWDLGWDLVLNLSEGLPRQFLLPGFEIIAPEDTTGSGPRGFDLHAAETWQELPRRLRPGYVYLLSFSKETPREKGYTLKHYHVGIIHVDDAGNQWLYNTTTGAKKAYRRNLSSPRDRAVFLKAFANTGGVRKHVAVLEVELE